MALALVRLALPPGGATPYTGAGDAPCGGTVAGPALERSGRGVFDPRAHGFFGDGNRPITVERGLDVISTRRWRQSGQDPDVSECGRPARPMAFWSVEAPHRRCSTN